MGIEDRAKIAVEQLINARSATAEGRTQIDTVQVTEIVRQDQEAVAYAVTKILATPHAATAGWAIWYLTAQIYQAEYDDDSLMVLLKAAVAKAGDALPAITKFTPHSKLPRYADPVILDVDKADLAAKDAHRMQLSMSIERVSPDLRDKMLGRCILTFPAPGDDRPVQHIPQIRGFVADLHRRMPYFPIYLCFDPRASMQMVYFGCLGDVKATQLLAEDGMVGTDMYHSSILAATQSAIKGMRTACEPLGVDWKRIAGQILDPYDDETRQSLMAGG